MLQNLSMGQFIDILASPSPAPGGGSVSAASGAMAGGLLSMVCHLSLKREELVDHQVLYASTVARVQILINELTKLVTEDTLAFNDVMAAFKLPKTTDAEKILRSESIQQGYLKAIHVPLRTAECCVEVAELALPISNAFNTRTASDLGVCLLCANTGMDGALMNVRINLPSLKDAPTAQAIINTAQSFENRMAMAKHHITNVLNTIITQ